MLLTTSLLAAISLEYVGEGERRAEERFGLILGGRLRGASVYWIEPRALLSLSSSRSLYLGGELWSGEAERLLSDLGRFEYFVIEVY